MGWWKQIFGHVNRTKDLESIVTLMHFKEPYGLLIGMDCFPA